MRRRVMRRKDYHDYHRRISNWIMDWYSREHKYAVIDLHDEIMRGLGYPSGHIYKNADLKTLEIFLAVYVDCCKNILGHCIPYMGYEDVYDWYKYDKYSQREEIGIWSWD